MKCMIVLPFLMMMAAATTYTTENDDIDIEALVSDEESLRQFIGCFMDTSPCNQVAADFKKDLPEAVREACAKCTAAQKHIFRRFLEGGSEKLPYEIKDFKKKYDPEGTHFPTLEAAIANA